MYLWGGQYESRLKVLSVSCCHASLLLYKNELAKWPPILYINLQVKEPINIINHHFPAHFSYMWSALYCVMSQESEKIATSKPLMKAVVHAACWHVKLGLNVPPIIISLFSNEPIVYLHLGWQPSRAHGDAEAQEVAIQILHVLAGDLRQPGLDFFFSTKFQHVANSWKSFFTFVRLPIVSAKRKGNLEDWTEGDFDMHTILNWILWTNPSVYP